MLPQLQLYRYLPMLPLEPCRLLGFNPSMVAQPATIRRLPLLAPIQ